MREEYLSGGIATHDPKFKERYQGSPERIVKYLEFLAEQIITSLRKIGLNSLKELTGRSDLLEVDKTYEEFIEKRNINLQSILEYKEIMNVTNYVLPETIITDLNNKIYKEFINDSELHFKLKSTDRAVGAFLMGEIARNKIDERRRGKKISEIKSRTFYFYGSAGHAFGGFLQAPFHFFLKGEANDFVGKSMCGGVIEVHPFGSVDFSQSLIGNTCFYGATGGIAKILGAAGDRFAIRNSGLDVLVGSVGFHACEYMTGGRVVILGKTGKNIGAGMTGGVIYSATNLNTSINSSYIQNVDLLNEDKEFLELFLGEELLKNFDSHKFFKYLPVEVLDE